MDWGCAQYTKELPYANHALKYDFKPGQPGKLVLEFWITPFDYAGCEGPERAVESVLTENKLIGLSLGGDRLRRRELEQAALLESFAQADVLRQCVRTGRLPADAAGAAVPQGD